MRYLFHPAPAAMPSSPRRAARLLAPLGLALALLVHPHVAHANETTTPVVNIAPLPPLGSEWRASNPYRGNAQVIEAGKSVYAQACLRCHGPDASGRGPAPDLRLLGSYCRRIGDPTLREACLGDADDYFRRSVLFGKLRLGIIHMPAWNAVLSQEMVWAVRTYIESNSVESNKAGSNKGESNSVR